MMHTLYSSRNLNRVLSLALCAATPLALLANTAMANPNYTMSQFESNPIVINEESATPRVIINTSNDHQLYFKAYNDHTDLDGDGIPDTTYKHAVDYYGYFDSYKCYVYDANQERFEPKLFSADKYCNAGSDDDQWSGNFLNWASMSRIDAIRKILFGGHRRVDTGSETVLERSYLPHDAHSWAKYYDGADLEQLIPFRSGIDYDCDQGDIATGTPGACNVNGVLDKRKIGITIGNTTDVNISNYLKNDGTLDGFSQDYTEPPLIKVVKGNHSLWASMERWQVTWRSGAPFDNHSATNANDPIESKIYAHSDNPSFSERLGLGNYIARVQACVSEYDSNGKSLIGKEKCKLYPGADTTYGLDKTDLITEVDASVAADDIAKPIGLLQTYGDENDMYFAMVSGTYTDSTSGGVLIRNIGSITDEINVDTDGIFNQVAEYAGGPATNNTADGLINAWSLYRIIGYDGNGGHYNNPSGDDCEWNHTDYDWVTNDERCQNWGNPFAEIYYQSINYLSGNKVIGDYRENASNVIPGLPTPQPFGEPLNNDSRCSRLSVINLNSSVISYDADQLDDQNYGPHKIWDPDVLPGNKKSADMTNFVGEGEGLNNRKYFIGETSLGDGTDDQMCTAKTITNFGETGGICPEAPRLLGSYKIAGLSYYAHVEDIRPESSASRRLEGEQLVDTYSVALASSIPVLEVTDPNDNDNKLFTLMPACRVIDLDPAGSCAIVDYKIVPQEEDPVDNMIKGSLFIMWETSEQGGDFDQDMWGTLDYELNLTTKALSITTDVHEQSADGHAGFGYVLGGTNNDGFHAHSGMNGYTNSETANVGPDCSDWNGCLTEDGASTKNYTLGTSDVELLKDPLWYAAKWGGFIDSNSNKLPDLVTEWDSKINETSQSGSDGIPDNYFYATNPRQLEDSLQRVFDAILERTSSGTAAAVVSSNVRGEGALFQAYFKPRIKDGSDKAVNWVGTVQALWLDRYGLSRQDCSPPRGYDSATDTCIPPTGPCIPNGQLDNYCVDQVVETFYDELEETTRVRVYQSNSPDSFEAYSMEGVVSSYGTGNLTMLPNSLEGNASFNTDTNYLTISPYTITGTVTAYDPETGGLTMGIATGDWSGPEGLTFDQWQFTTSAGPAIGFSTSPITLAANPGLTITISPSGPWIAIGDVLTFSTHNVIGQTGKIYTNWHAECIAGPSEAAEISGVSIKLQNSEDVSLLINPAINDFTTCTQAKISTYNLHGEEGESYSDWEVANLNTILGRGTSGTDVTLSNHDPVSLTVSPSSPWLRVGDRVRISNYSTTSKDINNISYLWNAREQLYLDGLTNPEIQLLYNRTYDSATDTANTGRYIKTWVDTNLNSKVDIDEYRDFIADMFDVATDPVPHGFFDVDTVDEAKEVVNYVRGIEIPGTRSRTIKFDPDDTTEQVMRLGDLINSTPTVVPAPQEAFDLIYNDNSYGAFRRQYLNRRIMVYAGGNDGLLHAFNGGFYTVADASGNTLDQYNNVLNSNCTVIGDKSTFGTNGFIPQTVKYSTCGYDTADDTAAVQHPLGSEVWAYAPMNLLSHLQWLKDPNYKYSHVYYVDGKPRVFDAKIFPPSGEHPNGWGTILVVGMNLGGGLMDVDTESNDATGDADDNINLRSAYVILDITNPEKEPELLGELPMPDNSFTSVYPAVVAFEDTTGTNCTSAPESKCNTWYLQFGTGPNNMNNYTSDQAAKMYLFDLKQLDPLQGKSPVVGTTIAGCTVRDDLYDSYHIIECPTGVANSFMGTPVVVDWNLDFFADTTYFGLVGGPAEEKGMIMRMYFNNQEDPTMWEGMHTLYQANRPITVQAAPGIDNKKNKWIFFGTGRYSSEEDKTDVLRQSLYGIKDDETGSTVDLAELLDTTDVEVFSDGQLQTPLPSLAGTQLNTFKDIENEIDVSASGWKMDLPAIVGTIDPDPATRNLTRSALFGGVLFTTVFQPSSDPCAGEGNSRLYGLFYKTGTAFPSPSVLGSNIVQDGDDVKYLSKKYLDLGAGFATSPAIHSGSGSGGDSIKVLTQLSTGDIVTSPAAPVFNVRTGRTAWGEN